jgi:hypothetical protein
VLESVLSDTLTCARNSGKIHNENWYEWVSHLVETSFEGKGTILWSEQMQTNRTILWSQQVQTNRTILWSEQVQTNRTIL